MRCRTYNPIGVALLLAVAALTARADVPHATVVFDADAAPGQWVNDPNYANPAVVLGWPAGSDPNAPDNSSLYSLGGFGGAVVLGFDHTVSDDPQNPFGLDCIVFGNAHWLAGDPNRRWTEAGVIEISRDTNGNGQPDDAWFLIPGSHVSPPGNYEVVTWDDDLDDATYPPHYPPATADWIPPNRSGIWSTAGYRLPPIFETFVTENPLGPDADAEGIWGYADCSPTAGLPSDLLPAEFYTRPDYPLAVGLTPGSAGGDAFDIAWAIDATTGTPANLAGFDFIRITNGTNVVLLNPPLLEKSTEIDAIVDVAAGRFGDMQNDGVIDGFDLVFWETCLTGPDRPAPSCPCRVLSVDDDQDGDLCDMAVFQMAYTGS